jgi:hypothetical protein
MIIGKDNAARQVLRVNPPRIPSDDYLSAGQIDLTPAEVRALCPWAVQLVALDGSPCWSAEDLGLTPPGAEGGWHDVQ